MVILDLDDLEAAATKYPYISAIHAPTVLALIAKLREAETVIETVRAEHQDYTIPHDEALSNMGTILASYKPTNQDGGDDGT